MIDFKAILKRTILRYANFEGRINRTYFWTRVVLVQLIYAVFLWAYFNLYQFETNGTFGELPWLGDLLKWGLHLAVLTFVIIPYFSLGVRRFHDFDLMGGTFVALAIACAIPLAGYMALITLIGLCCLPGTKGPNQYGEEPFYQITDAPGDM